MSEPKYIVIKVDGTQVKFLRHQGHGHYWSTQRIDAMEYTRMDVAQALAEKNGGKVEGI